MSRYDTDVPQELKELQEWFATLITQPIDNKSRIYPKSPDGTSIQQEAKRYIVESEALEPYQRLEIYSQQYWWRLLGTLHKNFPLTTRILGYRDFNDTLATPYLTDCPPNHWSLNHLGKELPQWVQEHYTSDDKTLIEEATAVDWAYVHSFFANGYSTNAFVEAAKNEEALTNKKLSLQPHLHMFKLTYPLLPFRDLILEEKPEHWQSEGLPPLKKEEESYHYIIYRNGSGNVTWSLLDPQAFSVLSRFRKASTLEECCRWIDTQGDALQTAAYQNLHTWFQEWTIRAWIGYP